jgi:hypothetical protein
VFLVNSRYPRFSATSSSSGREVHHHQRHTFSRSYGVNLPSSLARVLPSALEFSSHPPESVYGTVSTAFDPREAFPGSMESPSFAPEGTPHHLSALGLRLWPLPPTNPAYRLEPTSNGWLGYPPPSLLAETSVLVQEYSPASHRLRISASP